MNRYFKKYWNTMLQNQNSYYNYKVRLSFFDYVTHAYCIN